MFETLTDISNLDAAWRKVQSNRGAAGGDGVTVDEFAAGALERLLRLQRDLRSGTYRPGPLRRVLIPRRSGGTRPLDIPCIVDRIAQGAAALVIGPLLEDEMEDASFAYRPGRSVQQAVARIGRYRREGFEWVLEGDIERFFENVPHDPLLSVLEDHIGCERTVDLIALWLECYSQSGCGLPQGAPISPLLSNIYLDSFDEALDKRGVRLVRFADDFIVMCKSKERAEAELEAVADLLEQAGLSLHRGKTRVVPFTQGFRFLGHLFVRSLVLKEQWEKDPTPSEKAVAEAAAAAKPELADPNEEEVRGDSRLAQRVRTLYVVEPGAELRLRNEAFSVRIGEREAIAVPNRHVHRIEVGPGAEVSGEALRQAAATSTALAFVNGYGQVMARCDPPDSNRAGLHLAQARVALDPEARLSLAKAFVSGRLRNQRALLRRLNRRRQDENVAAACVSLNRVIRKIASAPEISVLLGYEGRGAAIYWPALGLTLNAPWKLRKRVRRPPRDPVNVVLSFLASLLTRDLGVLVVRHGLHPGFGVLHEARDGGEACVYDLLEPFRAPLVEGLAIYLFNNRQFDPAQFARVEDGFCRIDRGAARTVVRGYERWMARTVRSPASGEETSWRGLVEENVAALARHVEGVSEYQPYLMDY